MFQSSKNLMDVLKFLTASKFGSHWLSQRWGTFKVHSESNVRAMSRVYTETIDTMRKQKKDYVQKQMASTVC